MLKLILSTRADQDLSIERHDECGLFVYMLQDMRAMRLVHSRSKQARNVNVVRLRKIKIYLFLLAIRHRIISLCYEKFEQFVNTGRIIQLLSAELGYVFR